MSVIDLRLLLEAEGIDPCKVLVLRHRPSEVRLRNIFGWLAEEHPRLFNAYQRSHGPRTEAALSDAGHAAAFIGHEAGRAVFIGLYAVESSRPVTRAECDLDPDYVRLIELGMSPWGEDVPRQTALLFDLGLTDILSRWKGRLVVDWPKPDRSWYRWADPRRNLFPVRAIHEESLLSQAMPSWDAISLGWNELKFLPSAWRGALSHWRGVYFIFDESDAKGYVGSACGSDNMLGRWLNYAETGHGGNRLLLARNPSNFSFSILQRVSPDMPSDEVIAIEASWKARLHTYAPHGLNGN